MKKNYIFIFSAIVLLCFNVKAVNIPVSITSNAFTPASFAANVGDVVVWTLTSGTHTVVGLSVPAGAATINSGTITTPYSYTITVAGSYTYKCGIHTSMVGGFTVSTVGVLEPTTDLLTNFYPNPFKDKITIKYNGIKSIEVLNILGEKVKTIELAATESKMDVDFENLPAGIYFFRSYNETAIVETKRIIKSK